MSKQCNNKQYIGVHDIERAVYFVVSYVAIWKNMYIYHTWWKTGNKIFRNVVQRAGMTNILSYIQVNYISSLYRRKP